MEIYHVFVPGAVVGRATTHSERRATPLVRGGASNHGSWRKNVVNSYTIFHGKQESKNWFILHS